MASESDLRELLESIGDRAPSVEDTLAGLELPGPAGTAHRRWLPVAAAVAAVAAVAVSALVAVAVRGNDQRVGGGGPGPGPVVDRATYRLPLDAYYASATQVQTLQRAQFVLARRCAQSRGVTVPGVSFPVVDPRRRFMTSLAANIRPLTIQQARTIGYDLYPGATAAGDVAMKGLTPNQLEIVRGWTSNSGLPKPTDRFLLNGGCYQQATQTLLAGATPTPMDGVTSPTGLPGLFDDDTIVSYTYVGEGQRGEASREVRQAEQRWSSCMASRGYKGLRMTQDAVERAGRTGGLQSPRAKRQAVQDVECKQSTGFMTVWVASITQEQEAVIAAHRSQLEGFKARLALEWPTQPQHWGEQPVATGRTCVLIQLCASLPSTARLTWRRPRPRRRRRRRR